MTPRIAALLAALLIGLAGAVPPAVAQSSAPAGAPAAGKAPPAIEPGTLTRPEIRELMSRLSDDEVRALLLEQLDRSAAAEPGKSPVGIAEEIEANSAIIRERLLALFAAAPRVANVIALLPERLAAAGGVAHALFVLAILLAAGLAAGWLWRRRVRGQQDRIAARNAAAGAYASIAVFGDAFVWLILELSAVLIFYVVAMALLFAFWHDVEALRLFLSTYVRAVAITLAVMAVVEFCLPRDWPVYRLLPLSDATTKRVKAFILALALIWTFGLFTCRLLASYGAEPLPHMFLVATVATLFVLVLIAMFSSVRGEIAALVRGTRGDTGGWKHVRNLLAASWHVLAGGYVLLLWALSLGRMLLVGGGAAGGIGPGLIGLLLIVAVPAVDIVIGLYLAARLGRDSALGGAIRRTLRVVLVVGATAIFLNLWGVDIDRLEAAGIAGWLIGALIDIGVVALIGYAAWQLIRAYFDSLLERADGTAGASEDAAPTDGEGGHGSAGGVAEASVSGATRAATLLPLLRSFAMGTIVVMATLTVLAGLGVDIGPLLAGAGVVGIAIGFGAQTLVRDVVSGIFFLIDDAFRTGEYIDVGPAKGVVEKISVRSLRLRHHRGPLNTVPFGEIQTLTNYSRDWVIMKLPLRLTYDTDPERVKRIIKRIAAEMAADETLSEGLLDPPKSQGVLQMDDSAMILRVKFMAKPGKQFTIRRELLHRIRAAFEAEGVHFASREVTVRVAGRDDNADVTTKAAAAAARTVLDQEAAAQPGQPQLADER
jgi:small-conductance mechanosensitive channel